MNALRWLGLVEDDQGQRMPKIAVLLLIVVGVAVVAVVGSRL